MKASVLPIKKTFFQINFNSDFPLCDSSALPCAKSLASYLAAIQKSGHILFGHQNDRHCKAGSIGAGFTESDTADVTGEAAAVMGIDALSLTGTELGEWQWEQKRRIEAAVELSKKAWNDGSLITLSAHMPNFELIRQRAEGIEPAETRRDDPSTHGAFLGRPHVLLDNSINYSGYTPNDLRGNVVQDVLPKKPLNSFFTGYLDLIAEYCTELAKSKIPVIWRPFHENTGGWFWWGCDTCTPKQFKALWHYTWDYLTNVRNVHNLIWAYSPGSENECEADFLERYPGDAFVDLLGFDMYQNYNLDASAYWKGFEAQLSLISLIAKKHGKLFANTETGIMRPDNKALLQTGNETAWYARVGDLCIKYGASYFLLWANFGADTAFYTPYAIKRKTDANALPTALEGHELLDDFIAFHNDERVIFAHETPSFS